MDDVIGRGDDADFLVHRNDHRIVDLEQVVVRRCFAGLGPAIVGHLALGGIERRDKSDALTLALDVVVTPFPLDTGGLDGQVGTGGVFLGDQHLGGRQGHADDDDERNNGPGDLDDG
jgi:hypothetical protein